ncbi:MAG TPA: ADP-ribosylglycohydrolase family protein [Feifaniaceae bacterium]|nr:ADP-ribosylglycohydrolase family protein [Feifaniaceae bacterium]
MQSWFGRMGITELQMESRTQKAIVSDDTQMTLFTLDGLLWAHERSMPYLSGLYPSYLRWLYTQTGKTAHPEILDLQPHEKDGGILGETALFFRRAPGSTCLNALLGGTMGTMAHPVNNSKGCGGIMRAAPVGLFFNSDPAYAFRIGAEAAAVTHGHPTGYLAAGAFAAMIALLQNGQSILQASAEALRLLRRYENHAETAAAVEQALELASGSLPAERAIRMLGLGWIAEEALGIALYCALKAKSFTRGLILAVNHDGDSDSTGAICGNLMGAAGQYELPAGWESKLELADYIKLRARELCEARTRPPARI